MTDHNKYMLTDEEIDELSPAFDRIIKYAILHELASRLCENIDVTNEYRDQLVDDLTDDFFSTLRNFCETHGDMEPIQYPHRYKILTNRAFRFRGENFIPFPEVDTPYERFRSQFHKKRRVTFRAVRTERRPRK